MHESHKNRTTWGFLRLFALGIFVPQRCNGFLGFFSLNIKIRYTSLISYMVSICMICKFELILCLFY